MKPKLALTRSQQMSRIRGRNTTPEQLLRSALWSAGLRYRLHHPTPGGRADIVFPTKRIVVLVDGCFWHGCPSHYVRPRSREDFWSAKLTENVQRDRRQTLELERQGWRVIRIWEHAVFEHLGQVVDHIRGAVTDSGPVQEEDDWRVVRVEPLNEAGSKERRYLERLREPAARRTEEGPRITAKWRRPR